MDHRWLGSTIVLSELVFTYQIVLNKSLEYPSLRMEHDRLDDLDLGARLEVALMRLAIRWSSKGNP